MFDPTDKHPIGLYNTTNCTTAWFTPYEIKNTTRHLSHSTNGHYQVRFGERMFRLNDDQLQRLAQDLINIENRVSKPNKRRNKIVSVYNNLISQYLTDNMKPRSTNFSPYTKYEVQLDWRITQPLGKHNPEILPSTHKLIICGDTAYFEHKTNHTLQRLTNHRIWVSNDKRDASKDNTPEQEPRVFLLTSLLVNTFIRNLLTNNVDDSTVEPADEPAERSKVVDWYNQNGCDHTYCP